MGAGVTVAETLSDTVVDAEAEAGTLSDGEATTDSEALGFVVIVAEAEAEFTTVADAETSCDGVGVGAGVTVELSEAVLE